MDQLRQELASLQRKHEEELKLVREEAAKTILDLQHRLSLKVQSAQLPDNSQRLFELERALETQQH